MPGLWFPSVGQIRLDGPVEAGCCERVDRETPAPVGNGAGPRPGPGPGKHPWRVSMYPCTATGIDPPLSSSVQTRPEYTCFPRLSGVRGTVGKVLPRLGAYDDVSRCGRDSSWSFRNLYPGCRRPGLTCWSLTSMHPVPYVNQAISATMYVRAINDGM